MIVDEKALNPPPPYTKATPIPSAAWRTFSALPPHLLLQIVYATFADTDDIEHQRKTLYWLAVGLRLVNRLLYTTSMNVLRSVYLPAYDSLIRRPYSSDPFPHTNAQALPTRRGTPLASLQRETLTLDLFIALKVREDVWADESPLHLSRDEGFGDLFSLMQPRARLEDLVRDLGVEEGVVYIDHRVRRTGTASVTGTPFSSSSDLRAPEIPPTTTVLRSAASYSALTSRLSTISNTSTTRSSSSSFWRIGKGKAKASPPPPPVKLPSMKVTVEPLPFSALSVSFSSRRVGLVLTSTGRKRTLVEAVRHRDEELEIAARRLVWALRDWLVDEADAAEF